jgi:hypothetical protein
VPGNALPDMEELRLLNRLLHKILPREIRFVRHHPFDQLPRTQERCRKKNRVVSRSILGEPKMNGTPALLRLPCFGTIRRDRELSDWRGAEETPTVRGMQTARFSNPLQLNGLLYQVPATKKKLNVHMKRSSTPIGLQLLENHRIAQSDVGFFASKHNTYPAETEADTRMFFRIESFASNWNRTCTPVVSKL